MQTPTVPSTTETPWPMLIGSVIRSLLLVLGGFGFAWAQGVTGGQIEMLVSAVMVIASAAWSLWQKVQVKRQMHQTAVMSARGGKALEPDKLNP